MLAIVMYPDVQKHAQEELDAVVGRTRAPTFSDLPHLPYILAMVKEALRWRPVDPLGLPHCLTEDDWYNGMFIPKGSYDTQRLAPQQRPRNLRRRHRTLQPGEVLGRGRRGDIARTRNERGGSRHVRFWEARLCRETRHEQLAFHLLCDDAVGMHD